MALARRPAQMSTLLQRKAWLDSSANSMNDSREPFDARICEILRVEERCLSACFQDFNCFQQHGIMNSAEFWKKPSALKRKPLQRRRTPDDTDDSLNSYIVIILSVCPCETTQEKMMSAHSEGLFQKIMHLLLSSGTNHSASPAEHII